MSQLDNIPAGPDEITETEMDILSRQDQERKSRRAVIRQALEEHGELSFNELAEEVSDRMARNTAKKRIEKMKEDGIVEQTPEDDEWRQGQSKTFSIRKEVDNSLQDAADDLKLAKTRYLYGYEYGIDNDEVSVRENAPGIVWVEALETYHNDPDVDHVDLCEENAEKMLGETLVHFDESDTVPESFEKLHQQAVRIAAGKVFSEMFVASLDLNQAIRKDIIMLTYAEVAEFGRFWLEIWEEDWDVPHPDTAE
jgi:hypothetical protein